MGLSIVVAAYKRGERLALLAFGIHLVTLMTRHRESDDYLEFAELSRDAMDDVKHPWRIFTRLFVPAYAPGLTSAG